MTFSPDAEAAAHARLVELLDELTAIANSPAAVAERAALEAEAEAEGPAELTFTNGRTANHVLITDSGKVHYAADCGTRPYHVLACNGRAMQGAGWGIKDLVAEPDWCASCRRLELAR